MRTRIAGAAAAAALLTLATACGGIATQSQSGNAVNCGDTVSIGAPYPLSGVWAENGQNSLNGMQLAADQINDAGGIKGLDGAKIKIVSGDTSSDNPGQAKTVTENLLQQGNMSAVVGSYLSSMTLTTVVATETKKVPLITQSFVDDLTAKGYKYLFQIPPKASAFGSETVTDAKGVFEAMPSGAKVHWVVDPQRGPCPDCDDNVLAGTLVKGEEFPTGNRSAPAHPGCRCLVLVAAE